MPRDNDKHNDSSRGRRERPEGRTGRSGKPRGPEKKFAKRGFGAKKFDGERGGDKPRFSRDERPRGDRPFRDRPARDGDGEKRAFKPRGDRPKFDRDGERRPFKPRDRDRNGDSGDRGGDKRPYTPRADRDGARSAGAFPIENSETRSLMLREGVMAISALTARDRRATTGHRAATGTKRVPPAVFRIASSGIATAIVSSGGATAATTSRGRSAMTAVAETNVRASRVRARNANAASARFARGRSSTGPGEIATATSGSAARDPKAARIGRSIRAATAGRIAPTTGRAATMRMTAGYLPSVRPSAAAAPIASANAISTSLRSARRRRARRPASASPRFWHAPALPRAAMPKRWSWRAASR